LFFTVAKSFAHAARMKASTFSVLSLLVTGLLLSSASGKSTVQREDFPVGIGPRAIAFDGENIWVILDGESTVIKMQPSDGTILGSFPVGDTPLIFCSTAPVSG
jgi:hypothetical protein